MTVLVVTGTGTEIGKTVVTAAVAAACRDRSVAVLKPAQTAWPPASPGMPQRWHGWRAAM